MNAKRILIANRGEIATRIVRACRDLGHTSIAVYSEADAESLHVDLADESTCIGPPQAALSYLNTASILDAASVMGADAVHPGYGFLSENAEFAQDVVDAGLVWIGPAPQIIRLMGDKAAARRAAEAAEVPLVPGTGVVVDVDEAVRLADELGYPVLIKAAAGGGGRGIRDASDADQLRASFDQARREVGAAFGDTSLYLEKSLASVRHVEVQVLADGYGHVVHLHERDCSLQRRRQKLIEEGPAPDLAPGTRTGLHAAAISLARSIGYDSVGTVEFLVDGDERFYFIEANTRIQVEHGVTELLTGIDLVAQQIEVAFGGKLEFGQDDIRVVGHAIEVRINAEDPNMQFMGSPGSIAQMRLPSGAGIRIDSGMEVGSVVQPYYDSLIAKILVHGRDRDEARARLARALHETRIDGPSTTVGFVTEIVAQPWFAAAEFDTSTIEAHLTR